MNGKEMAVCFDSQACLKCFSCVVNCSAENRVRLQRDGGVNIEKTVNSPMPYYGYLKVKTTETGQYPNPVSVAALKHCMHCENPKCAEICPTKAIQKLPDGAVVIDQSLCVGCQACRDACPFDVPEFAADTGRSYKCIMCCDRLEAGLPTACSEACPSVAMFSGPAENVREEAAKRAAGYEKTFGKKYMVYGAGPVNSHVGYLNFMTIAPEENRDQYLLPDDPVSKTSVARDVIKVAAVAGAAVTAGAIALHIKHWKSKKDGSVYNDKDGE